MSRHDTGKEGKNMDLIIKYDRGSMVVHLEQFLGMRSTAKVKKLVKVIQASSTPDCLEQLQRFVEEQITPEAQYQADLKATANMAVDARTREKEQAEVLEKAVAERKRYKKKSPPYEEWNKKVKQYRENVTVADYATGQASRSSTGCRKKGNFSGRYWKLLHKVGDGRCFTKVMLKPKVNRALKN